MRVARVLRVPSVRSHASRPASWATATRRWASGAPASAPATSASTTTTTRPPLDFDNATVAYQSKTTFEIARAAAIFKACTFPVFVRNAPAILREMEKNLGKPLTNWLVEHTFFAHFCAGTNAETIKPTLARLRSLGVGGILDYAAEADVPTTREDIAVDTTKLSARTYKYAGEEECDANMRISLQAIATAKQENGFAAVKVTSLGKPELLQFISQVVHENRQLFRRYFAGSNSADFLPQTSDAAPTADDPYLRARVTLPQFLEAIRASQVVLSEAEATELFNRIDTTNDGSIDMIEWVDFLDVARLGSQTAEHVRDSHILSTQATPMLSLSEEMRWKLDSMMRRAEELAAAAAESGVRIMFDAEQTYLQPAIDHVTLTMQRKFNQGSYPVVFNTYQAYLRDCPRRLELDLRKSRRYGYKLGAKLVRGAYMVQERARAAEMGYPDPIWPTLEDTHRCYNAAWATLLEEIKAGRGAEVMVASHNETSIKQVVARMDELGLDRATSGVFFGQLLGMCDHVSLSLGQSGYRAFKYIPYGPVDQVIPYLLRRAQENSSLLGGAAKERRLLHQALLARLTFRA